MLQQLFLKSYSWEVHLGYFDNPSTSKSHFNKIIAQSTWWGTYYNNILNAYDSPRIIESIQLINSDYQSDNVYVDYKDLISKLIFLLQVILIGRLLIDLIFGCGLQGMV